MKLNIIIVIYYSPDRLILFTIEICYSPNTADDITSNYLEITHAEEKVSCIILDVYMCA